MVRVTDQLVNEKSRRILNRLRAEGIVIPFDLLRTKVGHSTVFNYDIFEKRWEKYSHTFEPTANVIQKVIELNDGLYERLREIYNDFKALRDSAEEERAAGKIKGYSMIVEYFFGYNHGETGIPTASPSLLYLMSDGTDIFFPQMFTYEEEPPMPSYKEWIKEKLLMEHEGKPLSWNIEALDLPGLENHYIYYFMHAVFSDSDRFYPFDIEYLSPEDLNWQVHVYYEK